MDAADADRVGRAEEATHAGRGWSLHACTYKRSTTWRGVLLLPFGAMRRPQVAPRSGSFFTF